MSAGFQTGLALALDLTVGELPESLHPVCWMGKAVGMAERAADYLGDDPRVRRVSGAVTALGLTAGVFFASRSVLKLAPGRYRGVAEASLLFAALAVRSLGEAAQGVDRSLAKSLDEGRCSVSSIVGRDTSELDETGVVRAAVESVAENTNDGIVAPMFYGFIGGAPMALAYKMANTLDSMIGYKNSRYRDFGWAAARLDDAAGIIPARLTALTTAAVSPLVGADALGALRTWRREAGGHRSPNAGVCESAFAGALGIRLGGASTYDGTPVESPVMGKGSRHPQRGDIARAVSLMRAVTLAVLFTGTMAKWAINRRRLGGISRVCLLLGLSREK